jgi:elongation factor G
VQPLLDAVCDYLPSPLDLPPVSGTIPGSRVVIERRPAADAGLAALAFKTATDPHLGKLVFLRLYSGRLSRGATVDNAAAGRVERVGRIFRIHANRREELAAAEAGDIVAVSGLKQTGTGDTLCDPTQPILLERMVFPDPVVSVILEPRSQTDAVELESALASLLEEDPTLRVATDPESGQAVLAGMGELHIEILVERLAREHGVRVRVGRPQVAYREAVTRPGRAELEIDRQDPRTGERRYARVVLDVGPLGAGEGFRCESGLEAGALPERLLEALKAGIVDGAGSGVVGGYPVTDVVARISDAGWKPGLSDETAFRVAGALALRQALTDGSPCMMEPMMLVEVSSPGELLGPVVAEVVARSGSVEGVEETSEGDLMRAVVPLRTMFGYATALRSATAGRATFSLRFREYGRMPRTIQQQVLDGKNG